MRETEEQTLDRVLSSYQIGKKLRQLRLRKKLGLTELGKHTGLSASMLSQLETGRLVPTLPTLARIAMVFDVGLEFFFTDRAAKKQFSVVRAGERMRFPERPDVQSPAYFFECLSFTATGKSIQTYLVEFPYRPASQIREHFHDGTEFLYLLEGSLSIRFGEDEYLLKTGDSAYFDSTEPHAYRGGRKGAKAIVVTSPLAV